MNAAKPEIDIETSLKELLSLYPEVKNSKQILTKIWASISETPLSNIILLYLLDEVEVLSTDNNLQKLYDLIIEQNFALKQGQQKDQYFKRIRAQLEADNKGHEFFTDRYLEKHEPRKEDKHFDLFRASKTIMQKTLDIPCFICGMTNKKINEYNKSASVNDIKTKLRDELNVEQLNMELHHFYVEYSYVNDIDLDEFNNRLLPLINSFYAKGMLKYELLNNPEAYELIKDQPIIKDLKKTNFELQPLKSYEELNAFVTGHPYNMMSLCTTHHRSYATGIHEIVMPFWLVQKAIKTDDLLKQNIYSHILKTAPRA